MRPRQALAFALLRARGCRAGAYYSRFRRTEALWDPGCTGPALLSVLKHCQSRVPYYSAFLRGASLSESTAHDVLRRLPILTKDLIRKHAADLASTDLSRRRWSYNTSGGSTGEPVRLIQDREYKDRIAAITLLMSELTGFHLGDRQVRLWGSERDILEGSLGWKARLMNAVTRVRFLNAFRMSPAQMREYLSVVDRTRPMLITAYAQALYELARFAEDHAIRVRHPGAIIATAGTLYPFMREAIERVFGNCVYNRYGSREVANIGIQCDQFRGLHVPSVGNYIEIVDDAGQEVPPGTRGRVIVTALTNFAMPLLRYDIGDRAALSTERCPCGRGGQALVNVFGRTVDAFRTQDGAIVDGEYFTHLLYFRPWVRRFQVVQHSYEDIEYKVATGGAAVPEEDESEVVALTQRVMGKTCRVHVTVVKEIVPCRSGKLRYTISEVQ